jgi:hypothetical protein
MGAPSPWGSRPVGDLAVQGEETYRAGVRCRVRSLEWFHEPPSGDRKVDPEAVDPGGVTGLAKDVVIEGRELTSLGTAVEAV